MPAARFCSGLCLSLLGAFEEGERALRSSVVSWAPLDFSLLTDYFLAQAQLDHGAIGAALEAARALIDRSRELAMLRHEGRAHWLLAQIHVRAADLGAADREVAIAVEQMPDALTHHLSARVLLASIRLAQRRFDEALRLAEEVHGACSARKIAELPALLAYAESLHAVGAVDRARARLAEAHHALLARAEVIGAPALRRSFVARVPVHARIVELVAAWHLEPEPDSQPPLPPRVTL
jgi:tetratricopeptide (TPR) repeat protein